VLLGALRLVHGFAFGILTTLNMAQFFDLRPRNVEPGRAMGYFAAFIGAGFVIGGFLGGWWADTFGYESAFAAAAVFPLLGAAINLQIRGAPGPAVASTETPSAIATGPRVAAKGATLRASFGALRNPGILMAALLLFCTNLLNQAFTPYFTLYALEVGHSLTVIGFIGGVGGFAALWVRVIAGELGRWWSYTAICRAAITVSALAAALVPTTTWLWALAALLTVVYVLRSVLTVTGGASVIGATDTTAGQRGLASGIFNMGKDLGSILGPILGGLVAGQVGVGPMLPVMAVATLALFWGGTALLEARLRRDALTPALSRGERG
jgi:DHA1 family multidrug resistance protein-like MFS transporter